MAPVTTCDGKAFTDFLVAGTFFLRKYRSAVDALNVFPVPDGDTGANMLLTTRSAMIKARRLRSPRVSAAAAAAAEGSLMGARGNSGVIISQMLRGFSNAVRDVDELDAQGLADGLGASVRAAREALVDPVEGTMLSVAAAAAEAAAKAAPGETDLLRVLAAMVEAANIALERTKEQLPVLSEAQVVDAGGQGLAYFLEGALRMRAGNAPYQSSFPLRASANSTFSVRQRVDENRFCTEFLIEGAQTTAGELRAILHPHGDSLIVAGGDSVLRVHLHTDFPQRVARLAGVHGRVTNLKAQNMEEQHDVLVADKPSKARGLVAVVPGEGFAKIYRELGADVTVMGGWGSNPSVKDLLAAVNRVLARTVYLLPNDKNGLLAAEEVDALTDRRVIVVPSRFATEGIAVLINLTNEWSLLDGGREDESQARPGTLTSEELKHYTEGVLANCSIFHAGKDAIVGDVSLKKGELVGAVDCRDAPNPRLIPGADARAIAVDCIRAAAPKSASLVTFYYGAGRTSEDADEVADAVRATFPLLAVEAYYGGQASDYVISIER
ncbi:MAG: DAK2 domain-containing protein [Candidatus Eremiobacteraeota bacterium]|nr:DAK2 domain-containing protein [Candidatus Eremiobacteraeota bacterium]